MTVPGQEVPSMHDAPFKAWPLVVFVAIAFRIVSSGSGLRPRYCPHPYEGRRPSPCGIAKRLVYVTMD